MFYTQKMHLNYILFYCLTSLIESLTSHLQYKTENRVSNETKGTLMTVIDLEK